MPKRPQQSSALCESLPVYSTYAPVVILAVPPRGLITMVFVLFRAGGAGVRLGCRGLLSGWSGNERRLVLAPRLLEAVFACNPAASPTARPSRTATSGIGTPAATRS